MRYLRPGESTNFVIRTSAVGGFNGEINLSCSPVAGITCAFNPATILSRIKHCIFHINHLSRINLADWWLWSCKATDVCLIA